MIAAVELSKRFLARSVLEAVSFEASAGGVLGFLGPNGAGKTTTMRILTTYLPPSSGRVTVCGLDAAEYPREARAKIGYLPESVPLYPEMRVLEYLQHRAALKGVSSANRRQFIDEAMAHTGITSESRRLIGQLSKGYRQRVGLADALSHRPEVLILDEPTDGLDPNQRADVLALIRELGKTRTVILSTHILSEVEAVCSRVIILNHGKIIAQGETSALCRRGDVSVIARGDAKKIEDALAKVEGVERVDCVAQVNDGWAFTVLSSVDSREQIARAVIEVGELRELKPTGLAGVFERLTRSEGVS